MTPDVIYDQMVAAGVARKLIFSWLGNPGRGRPQRDPARHGGRRPRRSSWRSTATSGWSPATPRGRRTSPSIPLRSYFETDLPVGEPADPARSRSPYGDGTVYAVPPLKPDVTIVHAQRADAAGNTQVWGLLGCQKEAAFAAERVIVVVEELVDEAVIRADPNRTIIPGLIVDAVVVEPLGRPPLLRPGRLRPGQPLLPRLGPDQPRRGDHRGLAARVGLRPRRPGGLRWRSSGAERLASPAPAGPRHPASSTTGSTADGRAAATRPRLRASAGRGLLEVRDDDRGRRPRAGRPARLLRRRRPPEHRGQPGQADGRPGHGARLRGGRLRGPAGPPAALDRRPDDRHRGHGRHLACSSSSRSTSRAGSSTSASWAPPRSTASGTSTRRSSATTPPEDAPAGLAAGPARSRSTPARSS